MSIAHPATGTRSQSADRIDISGTARVPFGRMVSVELRKLVDTRAGRWMLGITLGLVVIAMVAGLLFTVLNDIEMSFEAWLQILAFPISLLLPVVAIMSMTQEWGQRTALVTFCLEPRRARVVLAKLAAVSIFALLTLAIALLSAILGNLLFEAFSPLEADWTVPWSVVLWTVYTQLAFFVMAFGFGMMFLNTPVAIVLYYLISLLLPFMVYGPVYAFASWGPDVVPWFDLGLATAPFLSGGADRPDNAVAQLVVASLLWIVAPFVLGLMRVRRVELK